jgi:ketopantoate reductase
LNQAVVERAEHHGLAAPINQMLTSLVRACHP